jgi:hypothetical protein
MTDNPSATVTRFVDAFNRLDVAEMSATFAVPSFILDGMAPHVWSGPTAAADWCRDALAEADRRRRSEPRPEILGDALVGADDGELFVERSESESLVFDDGRLKSAAYDASEGFGLRVVAGETAGYAHANEISAAAMRRAADSASLAKARLCGRHRRGPARHQPESSTARTTLALARLLRQGRPAAGDRRLGPGPRSARGPGDGLPDRRAPGGRDPARRRPGCARRPPAGPAQRPGHRRARRPARKRLRRRRRPRRVRDLDRRGRWQAQVDEALRQALVNLDAVPARPARWTWSWAPAGTACCCTKPSATAWKATSTARARRAFSGRIGERVAARRDRVRRRLHRRPPRLAERRRRGHPDRAHRPDRGRHPGRATCTTAIAPA